MTWDSVDLPHLFGPMMACTSPRFTVSESPCRISRSSTRTCRFLTSSSDIHLILKLNLPVRGASQCAPDDSSAGALPSYRLASFAFHSRACREWREVVPERDCPGQPSANTACQRDRDQLLRLDREFHRQLLQHVLHKAVDHEADCFFLAQPALHAVEQHVLRYLRRGRFMLEQRRGILRLDIRHCV